MTRLTLFLLVAAASCTAWKAQPLPTPVSRPVPGSGTFRAGAGIADITPPPGVGLGGSGPEGRRSTGIRLRLFARALVLEDKSGERIAFVVADLPHISVNLHRRAAARLLDSTGIGADRLILSATHTHSGPGHFYAERQYNKNVTRYPGYDPRLADFLVERIARAVHAAVAGLRPARLAWGERAISDVTGNRSMPAWCRNEGISEAQCRNQDPKQAVDPSLLMIRADEAQSSGAAPRPIGSYSIFAIHGTGIPTLNTLLDGDIQARVVRRLQWHTFTPQSVPIHLFANGAEGDAAPIVPRYRCEVPRPGILDLFPMPRGPGPAVDFLEPAPKRTTACMDSALAGVERLADSIARPARALFDELLVSLSDTFSIRRSFGTSWLPGSDGLCGEPLVGSSTGAGAEGMGTRIRGWRWILWPFPIGLEEGGMARDTRPPACHTPKRPLFGSLQSALIVGDHGFPETAQLSVVRIGSLVLAAVPAEVTLVAGRELRTAMEEAAARRGWKPARTAIIGLADGYLQYVTTAKEYQQQDYEGGSNLYGPASSAFLARRLGELTSVLPRDAGAGSPPAQVVPITAYPGAAKAVMPLPAAGPERVDHPGVTITCTADSLSAQWRGRSPGRVFQQPGYVLVYRPGQGGSTLIANDGDSRLELHLVRIEKDGSARWRAVWRRPGLSGIHHLTVREGAPGFTRGDFDCR
jgi:neutral ceramidase